MDVRLLSSLCTLFLPPGNSERKLVLVPGQEGHGAVRDAVETALRPVLTWDASNKAVAAWARARCANFVCLSR